MTYRLTPSNVTNFKVRAAAGRVFDSGDVALLVAHIETTEAEVARLRDALESIEGGHPCDEEHREMARAALRTTSATPVDPKSNG